MSDQESSFVSWIKANRSKLLLLAILVLFVYGFGIEGCSAHRVGEPLSHKEIDWLKEPPLPYSVAVVPWTTDTTRQKRRQKGKNRITYAKALVESLENSRAFRSVVLDTSGTANVDLLAESAGAYCNSAIIPVLTGLTLGLYPTIWDETDCVDVKFRPGSDYANTYPVPVFVRFSQEARTWMGWLAIPLGLAPGWTNGEMRKARWYNDRFRMKILEQEDVIHLAASKTTRQAPD